MIYGADYYPEHWLRSEWEEHARLMKEAGINTVRLAEFSWVKMEPRRGQYDFSWLDDAIEVLQRYGISVVMCTPTATPPKWLCDELGDIYQSDRYGQPRAFGSRRHYCYNHPHYEIETTRITAALGEHYAYHSAVIAWQLDNEFGCHDTVRCYCPHCQKQFRQWLKRRYGTVEALNEAWGTIFWSQCYASFDEVIVPAYSACDDMPFTGRAEPHAAHVHNPGMLLDFYRFSSESVQHYAMQQIQTLRSVGVFAPITHNFMGHFDQLDAFELASPLDFVSWDNYVSYQWGQRQPWDVAMAHDLMRGLKEQNFWVMEQQSGPCGWNTLGDTPKPGQLRLWVYQGVAHGADAIVYFRWRACLFGMEQYWYGILDHDGKPRRRYAEVKQTGEELQRLCAYVQGARVANEAAIVKNFDNLWSHQFQPHNPHFDYNGLLGAYYRALYRCQIGCDMVSVETDFAAYKLVCMPAFNLVKKEHAEKCRAFVHNGGTLVLTFRSGTRNWDNAMVRDTIPGLFAGLAGITVEEFDSLRAGRTVRVAGELWQGEASVFCDVIEPGGADVLARYESEYYRGHAAVTRQRYGKGAVVYVGCDLDDEAMRVLLWGIARTAGVNAVLPPQEDGIESVKRVKDKNTYVMVMNHNGHAAAVRLDGLYEDMLSGRVMKDEFVLPAYDVAVLMKS